VNCVGGTVSHEPPRQPQTGRTAHYFVPSDNPFVGVPGALEEFWSIGLRNPHRIAFDPSDGRLWSATSASSFARKSISPRAAATTAGAISKGTLPMRQSPLAGQSRPLSSARNHRRCMSIRISTAQLRHRGFVYRGKKFPELAGKYIYGDNGSGRSGRWSTTDRKKITNVELTALPVSSKPDSRRSERMPR